MWHLKNTESVNLTNPIRTGAIDEAKIKMGNLDTRTLEPLLRKDLVAETI